MTRRVVETILTALLAATSMCIAAAQRVESDILIDNVTLISPERVAPLEHADVAIREGRIADVGTHLVPGPHTRKIDDRGRFLVPGLIDSHVHVGYSAALDDDAITAHPDLWAAYRAQLPRAYLAFGFTSIVDLDLTPADKSWFEASPSHPPLLLWKRCQGRWWDKHCIPD